MTEIWPAFVRDYGPQWLDWLRAMWLARRMYFGPVLEALIRHGGKSAGTAIRDLARDPNPCLRGNLAIHLDQWRHRDAGKLLRELAHDPDFWPRCATASALGALRGAKDLPLLRQLACDPDAYVRREAVWAFASFGRPSDIRLLQERLWDKVPDVRATAAMALSRVMHHGDLEVWIDAHLDRLGFEPLKQLDYALYAPTWIKQKLLTI